MRELVLARISRECDGVATVALVDYDAYTVAVKCFQFTGGYHQCAELKESLDSGKMRKYRPNLTSKKDVWLAHDPMRGCLVLRDSDNVMIIPADEYIHTAGHHNRGYYRDTGASFHPVRLGAAAMVESFWDTACAIMENKDAKLNDEEVRKELRVLTGVDITYDPDNGWDRSVVRENYTLNLHGMNIDKVVFDNRVASINLDIFGGTCEEVVIRDAISLRLYGEDGEGERGGFFNRIIIGDEVQEIISHTKVPPELIPESPACRLEVLEGYEKTNADLSGFHKLNTFKKCWGFRKEDRKNLSLLLPGVANTSFEGCFTHVTFEKLLPYRDSEGNLDIMGMNDLKDSFWAFDGLSGITGRATRIEGSFTSETFNGTFDVDTDVYSMSFAYSMSRKSTRYDSDKECVDRKNKPKGVIRVHEQQQYTSNSSSKQAVGSTVVLGEVPYQSRWEPWEQDIKLYYDAAGMISSLTISTHSKVRFEILTSVRELTVRGDSAHPAPVLTGGVHTLKSGKFPYKGVRNFGDKCFYRTKFDNIRVCELEEDVVQTIGDRSFYQACKIDYLVIPKSCYDIGAAAFSEFTSDKGDLTTICVYRDSWAHTHWSKGKKLKILVIDSIEDIPAETSAKSETDFIAAFVETPVWAVKSRPFVAKLLYTDKIDLLPFLPVVAQLDKEVSNFFHAQEKAFNPIALNSKKEEYRTDVEAIGCEAQPKDGFMSRSALKAAALEAVYGSCLELLTVDILKYFTWTPYRSYGVTRWHGSPKVKPPYGGPQSIDLYLRDNDVLYVGCGSVPSYDSGRECTQWETPKEVISSEALIGPETEGRLTHNGTWGNVGYRNFEAFGEALKDKAKSNAADFLFHSMVLLHKSEGAKSGRVRVSDSYIYDVPNAKIYKFASTDNQALGTYTGEVSISDFHKIYQESSAWVKDGEVANVAITQLKVGKAEKVAPCFEAEYSRTNKPFKLNSNNVNEVNVTGFIDFLTRSGLVKRLTESSLNDRVAYPERETLMDNTRMLFGKSPLGNTHLLGIWRGEKYIGFEAGFDMRKLAETLDARINGRAYKRPSRGYFNICEDSAEIFPVTPRKGKSDEIALAIDLLSGKLVLALYEGYGDSRIGIICSFSSAKEARDFFTAYGCKFLLPPQDYFNSMYSSSLTFEWQTNGDNEDIRVFTVHPHSGDDRIKNSLLAIGGLQPPKDYEVSEYYDAAVLTYCKR